MKTTKALLVILLFSFSLYSQQALDKYEGPFEKKQLQHLLRRTMFGASLEDMNYFKDKTMDQVMDELLSAQNEPDPPLWHTVTNPYTDALKVGQPWINTSAANMWNVSALNTNTTYWWVGRMLKQDKNIREKMILFFENHLPSNTGKDVVGYQKFHYERIKLLSEYSVGNYKDLINKICTNAAMMIYLDQNANSAYKIVNGQEIFIKPNENFARELQEIYTVGKGPKNNEQLFNETDVQAAAEILTGWNTCNVENPLNDHNITAYITNWCKDGANWEVQYASALHSRNDKQFSSWYDNKMIKYGPGDNGGQEEINELIDMLFQRKETSENLARKLYRFFVYAYISDDVELNVIQPLSKMLKEGVNGGKPYELKDVIKVILTSNHFYDNENIGVMVKNPADLIIGLYRTFGAKYFPDTTKHANGDLLNYSNINGHYVTAYGYMTQAGINLANVPDVAGYPAYFQYPDYHHHWLNSETLRRRKEIVSLKTSNDTISFTGFIRVGQKNNINYQYNDNSILIKFVEQLTNQEDVVQFVQQNIDHFLAQDLAVTEKDKLKNILEYRGFNKTWKKTWIDYKSVTDGSQNNSVLRKLSFFYDALFSYAEFQLM